MNQTRRTFLVRGMTAVAASPLLKDAFGQTQPAGDWKNHIGLEVYTVRNLTPKDYEGTIAKVAEIGYTEIEPVDYGGLSPKDFRAMLDRYHLTAPSTHAGATEGPDLEKQLEGFQTMGIHYIEIRAPRAAGPRPPNTEETVKGTAAQMNRHGEIAKKFGMKLLFHNHTMEFAPLEGTTKRTYDVLLAETDPALVTMQLDIGWASVAGQDISGMFHKNPGRFELWHVKDANGIKAMTPGMTQGERMKAAKLVPVGEGEVDYKAIFGEAKLAGLKHFCIEQDNAIEGDSLAAARTSYRNLRKILA